MSQLRPEEIVVMVKQVYGLLKLLTESQSLAGLVLTNDSFDQVKRLFGDAAIPYQPASIDFDPFMNETFVIDGLLIMRGTQLQ